MQGLVGHTEKNPGLCRKGRCSRGPSTPCRGLCSAKHCFLAKPSTLSWGQTPDQPDTYRTSRQASHLGTVHYRAEKSYSDKNQASFLLTIKPDKAAGQQPSPSNTQHDRSIPRAVIKIFWTILNLRCLFMLKVE